MRVFLSYAALQSALDLPALARGAFRFAKQFAPAGFVCHDCGELIAIPFNSGCGTGYGYDDAKHMFCYPCGGKRTERDLIERGKGHLYLTGTNAFGLKGSGEYRVGDWTGTFSRRVLNLRTGHHNRAGKRYDVWFMLHGDTWHGVTYGDNTQVCHVRKVKG